MEFPEKIKRVAKEASAYTCCICHNAPVMEVHHIDPTLKPEKGLHDLDNAAPLCANCHNIYGNDSQKRKTIKEMRDWWFATVKRKYGPEQTEILREISEDVKDVKKCTTIIKDLLGKTDISIERNDEETTRRTLDTISLVSGISGSTGNITFLPTNSSGFCPQCGRPWKKYEINGRTMYECPYCDAKL